jgi:hypothetical protein
VLGVLTLTTKLLVQKLVAPVFHIFLFTNRCRVSHLWLSQTYWLAVDRESGDADL